MLGNRMMARIAPAAKLLLPGLLAVAVGTVEVRGDWISLRGGGSLRGKLLPVPGQADKVEVLTGSGKTPLIFRREQIADVRPEPGILDDYLERREAAAETAEGQHDLARWCEDNKLVDLAERHDRRAVELDPDFGPSRAKLGFVRHGEEWLGPDELREAMGLVKHKGRWITVEERERLEGAHRETAEQTAWIRQLRVLRQAMLGGDVGRRLEAEGQVREIRDPNAVGPLLQTFGNDPDPIRVLLAHVLSEIPGPEASAALVRLLLAEDGSDVRRAIVEEVARREAAEVLPDLVRALRAKNPRTVNRAAWALGQLDAVSTVPRLIQALTTVEERVVWLQPAPDTTAESFGFYSGFGVSVPVVTAHAGPGVAAFGARAVPLLGPGGFASAGVNTGGASRNPIPVRAPYVHQNVEVRTALTRLTGQDFGFDAIAWKRWAARGFDPQPEPVRRVPQP